MLPIYTFLLITTLSNSHAQRSWHGFPRRPDTWQLSNNDGFTVLPTAVQTLPQNRNKVRFRESQIPPNDELKSRNSVGPQPLQNRNGEGFVPQPSFRSAAIEIAIELIPSSPDRRLMKNEVGGLKRNEIQNECRFLPPGLVVASERGWLDQSYLSSDTNGRYPWFNRPFGKYRRKLSPMGNQERLEILVNGNPHGDTLGTYFRPDFQDEYQYKSKHDQKSKPSKKKLQISMNGDGSFWTNQDTPIPDTYTDFFYPDEDTDYFYPNTYSGMPWQDVQYPRPGLGYYPYFPYRSVEHYQADFGFKELPHYNSNEQVTEKQKEGELSDSSEEKTDSEKDKKPVAKGENTNSDTTVTQNDTVESGHTEKTTDHVQVSLETSQEGSEAALLEPAHAKKMSDILIG